ncbi:retron Ec78 anti-phage system effector ATPase PtuA [Rheinheimera pacifica]|nr:retron Ec78 anti-phage system effector ATPase PtuA [Rheinheimera pacifica]
MNEIAKHKKLFLKSDAGEFSASYQLFKMYDEGIGVDKDSEKADYFKSKFIKQLDNYTFRISSVRLINFKGFGDVDLQLNKHGCTILVGNNGSGKSTILEAIQKTLSHLSSRLTTRSYNGDQIDELEIKSKSEYSTIAINFLIDELNVGVELSQSRPLSQTIRKSRFTDLNDLGNIFRIANSTTDNFPLPLLASYNVERANDVTTKDIEKSEEILDSYIWSKARGYSKSLTGKADFRLFFKWFKEVTEEKNENSLNEIKIKISEKEAELNSPLLQSIFSEFENLNDNVKSTIDKYRKDIEELRSRLNSISTENTNERMLNFVKDAIYNFLPGFSDLKIQRNPLDLSIKKNNEQLSVLQLSQGEKSLLALVADIARRLTLLNPERDNPLDGVGVVLIDEIDLHLHPSWQQVIVSRLQSTFKNIQFIITTHSPQVCHAVSSDNIWLLKDGKKYSAPQGVQGAVSSWVLKNLFEVEVRPPEDEFTKILDEYEKLVYSDEYESERAKELYSRLQGNFGSDYEVLVQLRQYIENREWEKEIDQDK